MPPDTVVPPFTVYGGKPGFFIIFIILAIYIDELPETVTHIHKEDAITFYNNFIAKDTKKI